MYGTSRRRTTHFSKRRDRRNLAAVEAPEVRYARSGDVNVAYSVVGDGPFDVVFVSGWVLSNLEVGWEGSAAEFYKGISSFSRLILFDKRGTGLSDRVSGAPDLETRMDDVRAVMDAAGSRRAAVMGFSEGGPLATLFAATYPERTAALVLYGSGATFKRAEDYPWSPTQEELAELIRKEAAIGTDPWLDDRLKGLAPTASDDPDIKRWWRRWVRVSASPGAVLALRAMNTEIDVRHVLPAIRVPTRILHRVDDEDTKLEEGRYILNRIPGAELVELPGADHGWWVNSDQIVREIKAFLGGVWKSGQWDMVESEQVLATILFTDIVGSTAKLAEVGDRAWGELLKKHHALVRRHLVRYAGKEMDTAGDGFFARFEGPARAIRCACAIGEGVGDLGLVVRQGLHTGECELLEGKVGGIAVHIGARVAAEAAPGEVLVSSTVRDLVAGSGLRFRERGTVGLKGIPGEWRLFSVDPGSARPQGSALVS
jgi:pimeloyl-ACP methyl ester carboxylesterase/class 3 adenylate cyclase